jgi:hypothetical protein
MSKKVKLHVVYTLQIKANATKQAGTLQVDDLIDSIKGTLASWFPSGEVELVKHDVASGEKRVVITDVLPASKRREPRHRAGYSQELAPQSPDAKTL